MKKRLTLPLILLVLPVVLGLLVNHYRARPLSLTYQTKRERLQAQVERIPSAVNPAEGPAESEAAPQPPKTVDLEEFQALRGDPVNLTIDARPEIFYSFGHIPGAINLPRDDFENSYGKHRSVIASNPSAKLLIYCQGGACEDSQLIAEALQKVGNNRLVIFNGGWLEWKREGLPEARP